MIIITLIEFNSIKVYRIEIIKVSAETCQRQLDNALLILKGNLELVDGEGKVIENTSELHLIDVAYQRIRLIVIDHIEETLKVMFVLSKTY